MTDGGKWLAGVAGSTQCALCTAFAACWEVWDDVASVVARLSPEEDAVESGAGVPGSVVVDVGAMGALCRSGCSMGGGKAESPCVSK